MAKAEVSQFIGDFDLHLMGEGNHLRSFEKLGAHVIVQNGIRGVHFAVWAPNASYVSVIGDFNGWEQGMHPMASSDVGIWTTFVRDAEPGHRYKYFIQARDGSFQAEKADPYAFECEFRPRSASVVCDLAGYQWNDGAWMSSRKARQSHEKPLSIYELHLGSWRRVPEDGGRYLTYRELAHELAEYISEMGFTHVELLPICEHPFDGSWGYQTIGYFAPTSRFGRPHEFMYLVDVLHQAGIGVLLDWVPSHFPRDGHGLSNFDSTQLYEHEDPRIGVHHEWDTLAFNFGRNEVRNFLTSSAIFWLEKYHIDGLRVDAVASMLYLDYSRNQGEWIPNEFGGNENLEAVAFVKKLNETLYRMFPDIITIAEESTAWPLVSRPTYVGGLGFGYKWNMGWMHDVLNYITKDPVHRAYHHNDLTFGLLYAFHENFILPFSHDEVVHGKGSMLGKMPGDVWQRFANLRSLYGFMYGHPGKKLLFMGSEFGQWDEWNHDKSLDWHLLQEPLHEGLRLWVRDLNRLLSSDPALHGCDFEPYGFHWIECNDSEHSVVSFLRRSQDGDSVVVVVCNFTPVPRFDYRIGAPLAGQWREALNSDATFYGGSGVGNLGTIFTEDVPVHGFAQSFRMTLPPLGTLILTPERMRR